MKTLTFIAICLFCVIQSNSQILSSGIASITFNNKDDEEAVRMRLTYPEEIPDLEFIHPKIVNGSSINWDENIINIIGKIHSFNHKSALYINNKEIVFNKAGFFNIEQNLVRGINYLSIKAVSDNGMMNEMSFEVDYQPGINGVIPGETSNYYALIVGINNYSDPVIPDLDRPLKDAEAFYNTLTKRYCFDKENVKFLKNASNADIIDALDSFAMTIQPNDNLLIFYAGHGIWDSSTDIGFWLPSDAQKTSKLAWFRNSTLRDYLREIKSKHTLLISDACFAGSILKTRGAPTEVPKAISHLYSLPSRKAMTSGTLTDVPDQSTFLKFLIERLDNNEEKYLSSEQLFSSFRIAVINNSSVVPQFGEIRDVGDQGGDFIFVLKD